MESIYSRSSIGELPEMGREESMEISETERIILENIMTVLIKVVDKVGLKMIAEALQFPEGVTIDTLYDLESKLKV